jgi:Flp pilus assembly protein TadG
MTRDRYFASALRRIARAGVRAWKDDRAAQIVEFAVSMPLLVVFVVGIFDFSQALSVKQKLMNAAREAARVAAADPANDLGGSASGLPASVSDAKQVVDNYLLSENLNDCGLKAAVPAQGTGLKWVSTSTGTCPAPGISLTVDRGCVTPMTAAGTTIKLIGTCVTLSYAYNWRFNSVIGLLGGNNIGANSLTAVATALNEN